MSPPVVKQNVQIFRAPWVVPVTSAVIPDGAVVLGRDSIVAVGSYRDISIRFPTLPVTKCSGAILPALVNAHIHLDLSAYGTVHQESSESTMCDWISSLIKIRMASDLPMEVIRAAAEKEALKQVGSGVGLMLDIGNCDFGKLDSCSAEIISLLEVIGPSASATETVIANIGELDDDRKVTGHAPYSATPELLRYLKTRSKQQQSIFSLHLSENLDESLLLNDGTGCFATFLKNRGADDNTFPIPGIDTRGVVGYLQQNGILDNATLCVHCVHMSDKEIQILADSEAHICLCPTSNDFLSVGRAPLGQFLALQMLPALGTDSIASNPTMDMWAEMALLKKLNPTVLVDSIFSMATYGGAIALNRDNMYGSLEKGKTSSILNVSGDQLDRVATASELLEQLITGGHPDSVMWLRSDDTPLNGKCEREEL